MKVLLAATAAVGATSDAAVVGKVVVVVVPPWVTVSAPADPLVSLTRERREPVVSEMTLAVTPTSA